MLSQTPLATIRCAADGLFMGVGLSARLIGRVQIILEPLRQALKGQGADEGRDQADDRGVSRTQLQTFDMALGPALRRRLN